MKPRSPKLLALAAAPLLLAARARVDVDMDDVPNDCRAMCEPIGRLTKACDTRLPDGSDADEKFLEAQCVCTNDSFDVGVIAGLCAGCVHQATPDKDAKKARFEDAAHDIDGVLDTCGFTSAAYKPESTALAQSVTVAATAPTDASQLTTTLTRATETPTGDRARSAAGPAAPRPLGGVSAAEALYVAGCLLAGGLLVMR